MLKNNLKILSIETSCDETAAAVLSGNKIKSNIIYSQLNLHKKTGGIVPEVASRCHTEKIIEVIDRALKSAKVGMRDIDLIAVTVGPGLIGSLLVGVDTARTLAYIYKKPIIPINHIEAHIYANFMKKNSQMPKFPAICLVVSGGHTSLNLMRGHGDYKILGATIDDAAGEAFDKVAKILGLGYPGGPAIAKVASPYKLKDKDYKLILPRPMINSNNFDFSFSGLKTAVLYAVRKQKIKNIKQKTIIAAEFQQAVIEVLVAKTIRASRKYNAKTILIGGGVAANNLLRQEMKKAIKTYLPKTKLYIPNYDLCTDNAAIVGICVYHIHKKKVKKLNNWKKIKINLQPSL